MGTFEAFDHTADVGLEVRGESLADLLETAARGVFSIMLDDGPREVAVEADVAAAPDPSLGDDAAELLVCWLQELLYRFETERLVPLRFEFAEAAPSGVRARVGFGRFDPERHAARLEVKAVTYHELAVRRSPDGAWSARFILDV
ncbi:MAG: archease [Planctomycetota bacterium]|nr:archease [Planctomycetota bacterium]